VRWHRGHPARLDASATVHEKQQRHDGQ
jgi:hypothetical protein